MGGLSGISEGDAARDSTGAEDGDHAYDDRESGGGGGGAKRSGGFLRMFSGGGGSGGGGGRGGGGGSGDASGAKAHAQALKAASETAVAELLREQGMGDLIGRVVLDLGFGRLDLLRALRPHEFEALARDAGLAAGAAC